MTTKPENPFYFDNYFYVIRVHQRRLGEARYLGEKKKLVPIQEARQFSSPVSAKRVIANLRKGNGLYEVGSITERIGPLNPLADEIYDLVEKIPPPYLFAALEWFEGVDVSAQLKARSPSTYYRYRKKLLEFGIDIATPSKVVIMRKL